jgi:hypothetical protein
MLDHYVHTAHNADRLLDPRWRARAPMTSHLGCASRSLHHARGVDSWQGPWTGILPAVCKTVRADVLTCGNVDCGFSFPTYSRDFGVDHDVYPVRRVAAILTFDLKPDPGAVELLPVLIYGAGAPH